MVAGDGDLGNSVYNFSKYSCFCILFNLFQKSAIVTASFSQLCFIQCFEPIRLHIRIFLSCIYLPELQIPGLVNVDFADVRAIMANAGSSLMGIGTATGKFTKLFG